MAGERYVVLALSRARAEWLRAVAHWTTAGSIPVELVQCLSGDELHARLASGRPCSAVLVDAGVPALDRDLIEVARRRGCPVVVVESHRFPRDWTGLGVAATLPERFTPQQLLEALGRAPMIGRPEHLPGIATVPSRPPSPGRVAMVCGSGGTGASTVAIALAQGLGHRQLASVRSTAPSTAGSSGAGSATPRDAAPRHGASGRGVLLADLALHADQAMLHDARDVAPGVQELVEAYRTGVPASDQLRSLVFTIEERCYDLLLGLRRARGWAALRPRTVEAAFDGLAATWPLLICDTDADLEGERETGSVDVEESHALARTAAANADVVFAVGVPGIKGAHSLVGVLRDLLEFGVPANRLVPVVNRAPRGHRGRLEVAEVLAALVAGSGPAPGRRDDVGLRPPVFLPGRRVDEALRDGVALSSGLAAPLVAAFDSALRHCGPRRAGGSRHPAPERVEPGTLGRWADDERRPQGEPGPGTGAAMG